MSIFDDVSRFLESRLDEFLREHPHLELQALQEQLREQEADANRTIAELQRKQESLQSEILSLGEDVKRWHERVELARTANRPDLLQAAQEREASLLRTGNQRWGQMEGVKQRLGRARELRDSIQKRRQEVTARMQTRQAQQQSETAGWSSATGSTNFSARAAGAADPLEQTFLDLETEQDLERLKRDMGRR